MKKYCVYTALVGNYDDIKQPLAVDDDFDYLLVSDCIKDDRIGVWEVKSLKYLNGIQTKRARYVKTHPEEFCEGYEVSVWIDASVSIVSELFYERIKELCDNGFLVSSLTHPDWTCTYQEMFHIMYLGWESECVTIDWGRFLRRNRFPQAIGTYETRVLFRKHSDEAIKSFDNLWWNCIDRFSRRDQYSFRYCLWKTDVDCIGLLPDGFNAHDNDYFSVENHKDNLGVSKRVTKGEYSWLMRYYMKHADEKEKIENAYYWIYGRKHNMQWLNVIGQCYRVKHLILKFFGRKEVYPWEVEMK